MLLLNARPKALKQMRLALMASHLSTGPPRSPSLSDLPKSNVFVTRLPPDPRYPTPSDSHKAPRGDLGPELVRGGLYTFVRPTKVEGPELLAVSPAALKDLGIADEAAKGQEFLEVLSGFRVLGWENVPDGGEGTEELDIKPGAGSSKIYPWAQNYGGFQFGQWAGQLGDGRALSLFETTNPSTGVRYELQLKGGGKTPYSRFADGRAVLRSSIREFIVSEALNALGIKTTRALSLTKLPNLKVIRERIEPGAIISRFAQSWIRIGTFDLLRARSDRKLIRQLAEYVGEEVYGGWEKLPGPLPPKEPSTSSEPTKPDPPYAHLSSTQLLNPSTNHTKSTTLLTGTYAQNRFARLYRAIVRANAETVAKWQLYGFTNGVLNTDNTSILGLSLDFGPFSFIDVYDPSFTPNHDDHALRYAYRSQPSVIWWNLVRLGESLGELLGAGACVDDEKFVNEGIGADIVDELQARGEQIIMDAGEEFKAVFMVHFKQGMAKRLGFKELRETDFDEFYTPWLDALEKGQLDFNHSFRRLSSLNVSNLADDAGRQEAAQIFFSKHDTPSAEGDEAKKMFSAFLEKWRGRVLEEWGDAGQGDREAAMDAVNPKVRYDRISFQYVY